MRRWLVKRLAILAYHPTRLLALLILTAIDRTGW